MAFQLRLPAELQAEMQQLAEAHSRSMHGEILHALRRYAASEKGKQFVANRKLIEAVQAAIEHAREAGMDESDARWMAQGAGIRLARETGVTGEAVSAELDAAVKAVVEQELKRK